MVSDRVGDFIVRLANAAVVGKYEVLVPRSAHLLAIANKLRELGFLEEVEDAPRTLRITLSRDKTGRPRLHGVKRLSKPGRRLYAGYGEAHQVKGGTGARILTSSSGIVTDKEARRDRVGGEALFEIW
jgi:small subunit ribosomal protein S8